MKTFADAEAALAAALPGYESRPQQQSFAAAVERVFSNPENFVPSSVGPADIEQYRAEVLNPRHLIAQAGCGTGKSLGYAIPAILSGRRVVVSVTTKALQDQLAGKDIPFLQQHLGVQFSWTVLKGRSNYFCAARAQSADPDDAPHLGELLRLAESGNWDGTKDGLPFDLAEQLGAEWGRVCSEGEDCSDLDCKRNAEANLCFASIARDRAQNSDVTIVNHALLFTDLAVRVMTAGQVSMLGDYEAVVMDEAHEVEEIAANTLGQQFSPRTVLALTGQVRNWFRRHADAGEDAVDQQIGAALHSVDALFDVLPQGRITGTQLDEHVALFAACFEALEGLHTAISSATYREARDAERARKQKKSVSRRAQAAVDRIRDIIALSFADAVRWIEVERTNVRGSWIERKTLKLSPINVAPFLRQHFYSKYPTVSVSATMAVNSKMAYIAGRLGIDNYDEIDVGTPFDFPKQARLYVPDRLPAPQGTQTSVWEANANEEIVDLIRASRGRALVLFTSVKHMRSAFDSVSRRVGGTYPMKMQGKDGTNKALAEWFQETTDGVLFGTKSFFTGVDFQGETCSLVIISKMPFPVPDEPLTAARCEAIERAGGSSFSDYTMPVMSLALQQGAGRLIRHRDDRGVVAILDPRIATKGYGKKILKDLPQMPYTNQLADVEQFFATVPA